MSESRTYNLRIRTEQKLDLEKLGVALKRAGVEVVSLKEEKPGVLGLDFG